MFDSIWLCFSGMFLGVFVVFEECISIVMLWIEGCVISVLCNFGLIDRCVVLVVWIVLKFMMFVGLCFVRLCGLL